MAKEVDAYDDLVSPDALDVVVRLLVLHEHQILIYHFDSILSFIEMVQEGVKCSLTCIISKW